MRSQRRACALKSRSLVSILGAAFFYGRGEDKKT